VGPLVVSVLLVPIIALGLEYLNPTDTSGGQPPLYLFIPFWILLVVVVLLQLLGFAIVHGRQRRRFVATIPTGTILAIGFRDETMVNKASQGTSETSYKAYKSLHESGGFVFLRHRGVPLFSSMPAELFTPESLAWLRAKVTK
jgi:hypothetical protein